MSDIRGTATVRGVTAEVCPGGAMAGLGLTRSALDHGAAALAATVVEAVAMATAQANQRTKHALRAALTGVDPSLLGLAQAESLTERAESTVPDTWRAQ
ncbi:YbaB/EbfC family DNA-binding protein [Actinophytocola sp. NPDC049390]|uniref:YbaB/EbfC family DNA-binding protein n=1 Tax=Actinophytocola sp. NPDC049390 TaxID=3363894 RepID=UPI0037B37111